MKKKTTIVKKYKGKVKAKKPSPKKRYSDSKRVAMKPLSRSLPKKLKKPSKIFFKKSLQSLKPAKLKRPPSKSLIKNSGSEEIGDFYTVLPKKKKERRRPINIKVTQAERTQIQELAGQHTEGNMSIWVREAALNYKRNNIK